MITTTPVISPPMIQPTIFTSPLSRASGIDRVEYVPTQYTQVQIASFSAPVSTIDLQRSLATEDLGNGRVLLDDVFTPTFAAQGSADSPVTISFSYEIT